MVHEHRPHPAGGEVAGQIHGDGRLAGPALGVQDDNALHGPTDYWCCRTAASKRCSNRRAAETFRHAQMRVAARRLSYGVCTLTPMERMLLLWDELDDLLGVGACLVSRALMRMTRLPGARRP